jgi:hypothetical protein
MSQTELISRIHASPTHMVLAVTGGGSGLISSLRTVPGASNTVLECGVPYASAALRDWLGITPDQNCSADTALQMAAQAHRRAVALHARMNAEVATDREHICGVGLTAALATNRERKGEERAFFAMHSYDWTRLTEFQFTKGALTRTEEEACLSELCVIELAKGCGIVVSQGFMLPECVSRKKQVSLPPADAVRDVIRGKSPWAMRTGDGLWTTESKIRPVGLLSGSFHPLHAAHLQLAAIATELLGGPVAFELPLLNADKPPVDYCSLQKRSEAFADQMLIVTAAPTFLEKSALFPGTTFVVGADTAKRICDLRFYNHSQEAMLSALSEIAARGCSFLVAARRVDGIVTTVDDLMIPASHRSLFRAIPTERFLWDLSSTEIRRGREE